MEPSDPPERTFSPVGLLAGFSLRPYRAAHRLSFRPLFSGFGFTGKTFSLLPPVNPQCPPTFPIGTSVRELRFELPEPGIGRSDRSAVTLVKCRVSHGLVQLLYLQLERLDPCGQRFEFFSLLEAQMVASRCQASFLVFQPDNSAHEAAKAARTCSATAAGHWR